MSHPPLPERTELPEDPLFWQRAWEEARAASRLKRSQERSPESWRLFYDQVSDLYQTLWSHDGEQGRRLCRRMLEAGLVRPGCSLLDVGCGAGSLALPLSEAGVRVTALDWSPDMLAVLRREAGRRDGAPMTTVCASWERYQPREAHDTVVAAFFPDAMSPEGLRRLEGWSRGRVALVLGTGREPFDFRRRLWEHLLKEPAQDGGFHLSCALGWLLASGRRPDLAHLRWPVEFDQPLETVARFYESYFAIFGRRGTEAAAQVRAGLQPWRKGDRVQAAGEAEAALVWWTAPGPAVRP